VGWRGGTSLTSCSPFSSDQQDRAAPWIEDEQDPHLGGACGSGAEFFEIVDGRALDPVDQQPTEVRADPGQRLDRIDDLSVAAVVDRCQVVEPSVDLISEEYLPRHPVAPYAKSIADAIPVGP
jgi:hypothetical protein